MSQTICSCGDSSFPNLGRPNCVIEMGALAFPILVPRYNSSNQRNVIDTSSPTIGQDILDMLSAALPNADRIYPFLKCLNVTNDRTETVYDTAPNGDKYRIEGVGGVRTWLFQLWGKDGAFQIYRELRKAGCTDLDFLLVDVKGNVWGEKNSPTDTDMHGYAMSTQTFDAFMDYATDTTVSKLNVSFDVDRTAVEANSYAITSTELGYDPLTSLRPNVSASQDLTATTATDLLSIVYTGFGSAITSDKVVGLLATNFTAYNVTTSSAIVITTVVEGDDGEYVITIPSQTASDVIRISVDASGYDVADATVASL